MEEERKIIERAPEGVWRVEKGGNALFQIDF